MKYRRIIVIVLILCMGLVAKVHIYDRWFTAGDAHPGGEDSALLEEHVLDPGNYLIDTDARAEDNFPSNAVQPIPLPLDEEMDKHLINFRRRAQELHTAYPDNFIISGPPGNQVIALTFDDGPDHQMTELIMGVLDEHGIPGTFFFVGSQLEKFPQVLSDKSTGSHQFANHSWSHPRPMDLTVQELMTEIERTEKALAVSNSNSRTFRPPYGLVTPEQMSFLSDQGYRVISWSVDSMDWYFEEHKDIVQCVVEAAHPGAIVLLHSAGGRDNRRSTLDALPEIIRQLTAQGYTFVTVDALLRLP